MLPLEPNGPVIYGYVIPSITEPLEVIAEIIHQLLNFEQSILKNGHGGMGLGVIQEDKPKKVSSPA